MCLPLVNWTSTFLPPPFQVSRLSLLSPLTIFLPPPSRSLPSLSFPFSFLFSPFSGRPRGPCAVLVVELWRCRRVRQHWPQCICLLGGDGRDPPCRRRDDLPLHRPRPANDPHLWCDLSQKGAQPVVLIPGIILIAIGIVVSALSKTAKRPSLRRPWLQWSSSALAVFTVPLAIQNMRSTTTHSLRASLVSWVASTCY